MMPGWPVRGLLVLNLGLASALAWLWLTPQGQLKDLGWQPPAPVVPEVSVHEMAQSVGSAPDLQAFAQVAERPLFSPSRRPPPPPKPPAPPPPPDPLANVHVYGIFIGEEEGTGGMLAAIDGKVRRITTSDSIAGWKIKALREREITLTRGEETRVLRLVQARPGAAPKVAAAPRPGAPAAAPAAKVSTPIEQMSPANAERAERRRRLAESRANAAASQ